MTALTEQCATTDSFAVYGIGDGAALISAAASRLGETSQSVEVSDGTVMAVENAFRDAFVALADGDSLPPAVRAAFGDAAAAIREADAGGTVDLRTEFLPRFYQELAGYHCAYRTATPPDRRAFEE